MLNNTETTMAKLMDYRTGETLRDATDEETAASIEAAERDSGRGVIEVDGRSCYVEGGGATTIKVPASDYEDHDDCLAAAAEAYVAAHPEAQGYEMSPRWESDQRDAILLDVPTTTT